VTGVDGGSGVRRTEGEVVSSEGLPRAPFPSFDPNENRQGESFSQIQRIQREIPADLLPSLGRFALKGIKEREEV
jgi:hypothetical protein